MSNKTINQALEGLYKGLGGDPSALADNSTCSDYIADLESAIKGVASGAQIDDSAPSETKVYSSAKTEELIGSIEGLPEVTSADIGEALIVESDGEGGAQWGKGAISVPQEIVYFNCVQTGSAISLSDSKKGSDIVSAIESGKTVILYDSTNKKNYFCRDFSKMTYPSDSAYNFYSIGFNSTSDFTSKSLSVDLVSITNTTSTSFGVNSYKVTLT